jgi:signal peptidase II
VFEFSKHFRTIAGVAAAVLLVDFVTKELALFLLSQSPEGYPNGIFGFSFALFFNDGAAGGLSLGENTRLINIASMSSVVVLCSLVWKQISAIHRFAPVAFGLITGAALGNTLSLLLGPAVVDFITFDGGSAAVVFNVADIAVVAGVGLLVPTACVLAGRIRESYADLVTPLATRTANAPRVSFEREVPITFASEVALEPEVSERSRRPRTVRPDAFIADSARRLEDRRADPGA